MQKPHEKLADSKSPAKKRAKTTMDLSEEIVEEILNLIHDKTESKQELDDQLTNLEKVSFEENRVDQQLMDAKSEEKRLSDQNDKKILEKQKEAEEKKLQKESQMNRNKAILLKAKETSIRKKELSNKHTKNPKGSKNNKLPNGFSEIPAKLKKYFPEENVILHVRPDGGVSCFSAHMFAQPHKGKHLRREVKKHMVSIWDYYKNKIGFPYERQVGVAGATVKDSDPFQFLNFLQTRSRNLYGLTLKKYSRCVISTK